MSYRSILINVLFSVFFAASCKKKDVAPVVNITISNEVVTLNPTGIAPLTATISFETSVAAKVSVRIAGKHGAESDILKDLDELTTTHTIPVLGLYPDLENTVELILKNNEGAELARKTFLIHTAPLPPAIYPQITIDKKTTEAVKGMTLVSYFGFNTSLIPQNPFVFDAFGDIRWYLDVRTSPQLNALSYDDGIERLQNGDLYFGDISSNKIYEMDMLGKIINTWDLPGYQFHHNVQEKPNGNFLVTVSKQGAATVEDFIIEIDRATKQIINTWDLNLSLQNNRKTLTTNAADWIHVNAIVYDPGDNTIIVSGRTQALVKLDEHNNVIWIMGCHKGWGIAGNGVDLRNFLLQPLDANNQPITNPDILDGNINHPDFEWNWYQHAPLVKPNGNLMVFDNGGNNRNFSGAGQYSRAVEYEINKTNKTVKQVWEYGKSLGLSTFSQILSDVDFLPASGHVIFSPGAVNNTARYGKVIEVDQATKNVLFEATIIPPSNVVVTFHRTERLNLYP